MTTYTFDQPQRYHKQMFRRRTVFDWLFAVLVLVGGAFALGHYNHTMSSYERVILILNVPLLIWLGWFWRPLRVLMLLVAAAALLAIFSYDGDLRKAETVFWLKYFFSSQSAILWMSALFFMATLFYWSGTFIQSDGGLMESLGSKLVWSGVAMALIGTLVRWFEGYLISPDIGHIPVSNLYEVLVMFCWMTSLLYLYYERHYNTRALGCFVMLVVSAAVAFLLWYSLKREAHEIQPLVPALQSWWMKLHVPANFVGYGAFAIAAMVALACLLKNETQPALWKGLVGTTGALGAMLLTFYLFGNQNLQPTLLKSLSFFVGLMVLFVLAILVRPAINARTPNTEVMNDLMYRSIALGFAFFTIATVLGAMWAADAWGGYWSWDPKETWALIVWLNYAAWLHMRLIRGVRSNVAAWWALLGLVVVTFAFLGVNMFLVGLHSYGTL